jgi:hypothetical protein
MLISSAPLAALAVLSLCKLPASPLSSSIEEEGS